MLGNFGFNLYLFGHIKCAHLQITLQVLNKTLLLLFLKLKLLYQFKICYFFSNIAKQPNASLTHSIQASFKDKLLSGIKFYSIMESKSTISLPRSIYFRREGLARINC